MKYNFLKQVDKTVFFNGEYMEIYIPKEYFTSNIAEYQGDMINTIGIFNFMTYLTDEESKNNGEIHTLKLPMEIKFEFDSFYDISIKLRPELDKDDYRVFKLTKGLKFIDNTVKEQSAENSKKFIYLLHGGKLPRSLKYEDIIKLYLESIGLNRVNLNNPSVIFEMIIAELCRYKPNVELPFRMMVGKDNSKVTEYDYTNINLKKLPSINSTFNAMTFEDINQAIISSIKKTRNNENENPSPVEKIIKY